MFYSPSICAFFLAKPIPPAAGSDAVEISAEEHAALFAGQEAGQVIVPGPDGKPTLQDPPAPAAEILEHNARSRRDGLLRATDGLMMRHQDELARGASTTLSAERHAAVLDYRQALRDLPGQPGWPSDIDWPEAPAV